MKYRTYRAVGRPRKRWEDEIKDFLRSERIENAISNVERNKWMDQDSKRPEGVDEDGTQVRMRDSSSTWISTLEVKEMH